MKIAMLSAMRQQTPPEHRGLLEYFVFLLTEGLVRRGIDVTLFTAGDTKSVEKPADRYQKDYQGNNRFTPTIWECLQISEVFEQGNYFDLIHNHLEHLPLTYSAMTPTPVVTTIYGPISSQILPVYQKYNDKTFFVTACEANKNPELDYIATIYPGISLSNFTFRPDHGNYLLYFGRIHPENRTNECIEVARRTGMKLIISGTIQDHEYFDRQVKPFLNNDQIIFTDCTGPEKRNQLFGNAYALLHSTKSDQHSRLFIAEAMACGTPVIALNNGSMPEFIADGITGFLVPDSDEMIRAVSEIKQLDRSQCRQWAEDRFSADAMVENYISIYKKILEQTKREDHRPWGFYEILLDAPDHKVKRITVYPGQRLSYQRHFRRSEHWYVIGGTAVITRNGNDIELTFGQSIDLPVGTWHRVRNPGSENMVFIEVQTGDYFGEDDIERSEDDYGRR